MDPSRHEVWKFEELYREIKRSYDIRRAELENLIVDHELIKEDWKLHFVVDFYQIFTFAFPLGLEKVSLLENGRERSHAAMMQAARAFVFYGLRECPYPVLISPYAVELRNWLSLVLSKGHESILRMRTIQNWGQSLLTEEERELIDKAISWYKLPNKEEKSPPSVSQLMDLVNKKFLDMYFLISGAMIEGIRMLRELYRGKEPRLELAHKRWENYDEMTREVKEGYSSSWYPRFARIRKPRILPNIRDALAVEIVMALNHHLMKNKEIVLLVSDAGAMDRVLNERVKGRRRGSVLHPKTGREIPILRTSNTFLVYMTSVEDRSTVEAELDGLQKEKREQADFYAIEGMIRDASKKCEEVSETVQGNCSECPHRENCSEISEKLEKHREKTNEIEIIRLILNRFGFLRPYLNFLESGEEVEENIEEIVKFLGGTNETLEQGLREKVRELERQIDDLIDAVEDPSIDLAPKDAVEFLAYRLKRLDGVPYRIVFENPEINTAIKRLFKSIDKGTIEEVRENTKEIFNLTHDPSLGNEGKLLLASLLYCFRHYEMVRDITLQMLLKNDLKERKEFVLLKCLSYSRLMMETRSNFYLKKAYQECLEAVKRYSDDPRFHNMLGVIIARGIESGLEKTKTIDDAIKRFQAGLEICTTEDNTLRASLNNNIAYLITQKAEHTSEELDYANDLVREMEDLWPREKWAADFWDTDGCVQLGFAELTDDPTKKKAFLKKADEKEKKAKEMGEKHRIREPDISLVRKRVDIIGEKLKELSS